MKIENDLAILLSYDREVLFVGKHVSCGTAVKEYSSRREWIISCYQYLAHFLFT